MAKSTMEAGLLGLLGGLLGRRHERAGYMLYTEAVQAARQPWFYTALGVPDTLDGRFDMVGLHVFLLIDRLRDAPEPGPALAQAVFDAMFADMDRTLRELGVGDMSVGRRNREMWEAFHGRSMAYEAALRSGSVEALAEVVARNVWRGASAPAGAAENIAALMLRHRAALAGAAMASFVDGSATIASWQAAA